MFLSALEDFAEGCWKGLYQQSLYISEGKVGAREILWLISGMSWMCIFVCIVPSHHVFLHFRRVALEWLKIVILNKMLFLFTFLLKNELHLFFLNHFNAFWINSDLVVSKRAPVPGTVKLTYLHKERNYIASKLGSISLKHQNWLSIQLHHQFFLISSLSWTLSVYSFAVNCHDWIDWWLSEVPR